MIKKYTVSQIEGTLQAKDLRRLCMELGGDTSSMNYFYNEAEQTAYGDFMLSLSNKDLEKLEGCFKLAISSNQDFLNGKDIELDFKCLVV